MEVSDRLLTAVDVAELLSVPVSWVREHTRSGRIPHVQLGRYVRYRQETVVSWVAQQEAVAFRRHRPQIPPIQNHILLLNVMLRRAVVWRLMRSNPVSSVDRPSLVQPEMSVLNETEIARLANAYDELIAEASKPERQWWSLAKAIVLTALGTALRRGELIGLRWRAVNLLEAKIEVRETFVRGRFNAEEQGVAASRRARPTHARRPRGAVALHRLPRRRRPRLRPSDEGTPLEAGKLATRYLSPALARAGIEKPFRPFHDLRHTSLTHAAAAGNPQIYVQARAGHSQGSITERYVHAAQVLFPGAAAKSEERMFGVLPDESAAAADD